MPGAYGQLDSKVMKGVMASLLQVVQRLLEFMEGWRNMKIRLVFWYVVTLGIRAVVELETSRRAGAPPPGVV